MQRLSLRAIRAAFVAVYAAVPLFPSFIALSGNSFPGVELIPLPLALAVLGLVCGLAIVAGVLLVRYPRRGAQPILVPIFTWFAASMLSALAGFDPAAGVLFVSIFGLGAVWHASVMRFYGEPGVARAIFWSYLCSGALASLAAVVMIATRVPAAQYAMQHGRATGTFVLPGELAAYLVVFLPIAFALARGARERALRAVAWIALGCGALAFLLTFSRAGWMGLAATVAFLLAVRARRLRAGATAALLVVAAGAAAVLLLFNAHHDPSEDYTRIAIWRAALQIIDRFPLTGVGPFDFSRLYALVRVPDSEPSAYHAHSLYLTFFAELGILGLSAFLWTAWAFVAELRRRLAAATPQNAALALAVTAGLFGVAVQGLIDTMSVVIFGLWLPTLALALATARDGLGEPPA
ncbi:MAG TPA: O-antigen ligase family protein [Verrucomicrobiae bacterium]|nr:O-antigen ligase family protein [Verrucomicrobiae bacterium]